MFKKKVKHLKQFLAGFLSVLTVFTTIAPSIALAAPTNTVRFTYVKNYGNINMSQEYIDWMGKDFNEINCYVNTGSAKDDGFNSPSEFESNFGGRTLDSFNVGYCLDMNSHGPADWQVGNGANSSEIVMDSSNPLYNNTEFTNRLSKIFEYGYSGGRTYWSQWLNPYQQYQATQAAVWILSSHYRLGNNGDAEMLWGPFSDGRITDNCGGHLCDMICYLLGVAQDEAQPVAPSLSVTNGEVTYDDNYFYLPYTVNYSNFGGASLGKYTVNVSYLPSDSSITCNGMTFANNQETFVSSINGSNSYVVKIPKTSGNEYKDVTLKATGSVATKTAATTYLFEYGDDIQKMALLTVDGTTKQYEDSKTLTTPQTNVSFGVHKFEAGSNNTVSVKGATYALFKDSGCTQPINGTIANSSAVTNDYGYALWENVATGTYYAKEVISPDNYLLSNEVITVSSNTGGYDEDFDYNGYHLYSKNASDKTGFSVAVHKTSMCSDNINVEGAVYGLYSDANCTQLVEKQTDNVTWANPATTNEWGYAIWEGLDDTKTYYAREITAPEGYVLNQEIIKIKKGEQDSIWGKYGVYDLYVKETKDYPQSDPVNVLLKKVNEDGVVVPGASLAGAQYEVKVYPDQNDASGEPTYTWVFETDENGSILLRPEYKVDGDDFYYSSSGIASIPVGCITIQEVKAPDGYKINDTIYTKIIKADGTGENIHTYNEPVEATESAILGAARITKKSSDGVRTVAGAKYELYLETENGAVKIDSLASDKLYTTDTNGVATATGLVWGNYYFKEVSAPAGYELSTELSRFTVRAEKDGDVVDVVAFDDMQYKAVIITKSIKASDIWFDHGNPQFIIKLTGTDVNGEKHEYNRIIEFTKEYVDANTDTDGNVAISVEFTGLVPGTYTASELDVIRYKFGAISNVSSNGTVNGDEVTFNLGISETNPGKATFNNVKFEWQQYSDTASKTNHIVDDKPDVQATVYGVYTVDNTVDVKGYSDTKNAQYRFLVNGSVIKDFGTEDKTAYTLNKAGNVTFTVDIKNMDTGVIGTKTVTVNVANRNPSAKISVSGIFKKGNSVTLRGYSDTDNVQYKFSVDGTTIKDFSTASEVTYSLNKTGNNVFKAEVKDMVTGNISSTTDTINVK